MSAKGFWLIALVFHNALESEGTPLGREAIRNTALLMADKLDSEYPRFDRTKFFQVLNHGQEI